MIVKQVSVFIENKPGRLAEISEIIAGNNINIRALSVADTTDFGILRIIVDEPDKAEKVLKDSGTAVSITSVVSVLVDDKAGGLAGMLKALSSSGVSIEYMYGFAVGDGKACIIMRIEASEQAVRVLKSAGYAGLV